MEKKTVILAFKNGRRKDYTNWILDDPVFEIRSLDPEIRIADGISIVDINGRKEAIEILIEKPYHEKYIEEYLQIRKDILEPVERDKFYIDYSQSREVGHILFKILSCIRIKHKELNSISSGHYYFEVGRRFEYKNGELIEKKDQKDEEQLLN